MPKGFKKKKKNQRTMRKNEKTFIQGKKNIETKRNSNRKKMTKGGWWQFCHSPSTDTIMPVFSPFQRDRIFVGSGKKFLDLANFFFFFLLLTKQHTNSFSHLFSINPISLTTKHTLKVEITNFYYFLPITTQHSPLQSFKLPIFLI